MDKVIKVEEEFEEVTLNLKSGKKVNTQAKTIYTYFESGRKDCRVEILKPLDLFGDSKQ